MLNGLLQFAICNLQHVEQSCTDEKPPPLLVLFTCWPSWRLGFVQSDQLLSEHNLGLHVHCFAALGNGGSQKNSICSAPVGSCMLKSCSPQLEFLFTCLSPFTLTVLVQPHSNLQLLKIICITAPGHVKFKDDPTERAQPFCSAGNSSSGAAFLS